MSPETELVFRSARASVRPEEAERLVRGVANWPQAFAVAQAQGATAATWRLLQSAPADVPQVAREAFARSALELDLRMQRLAHRARHTVGVFRERGIPLLLLKGAAHGALHDATFRSRPMGDIDILVRPADVERARRAVIDSGWPETTDELLRDLLKDAHHLPHFVDPQLPGSRLELHVRVLPSPHPFAWEDAELWRDAQEASGPFEGALVPSTTHQFLHAAIHFAWQHHLSFGAWKTFRLFAPVLETGGVDWDALVDEAHRVRAGTCCYWSLRLANRLCGLPVPSEALRALQAPSVAGPLTALERHFVAAIAAGNGPTSPSVRLTTALWRLAIRPGWSGHPRNAEPVLDRRWLEWRGAASAESGRQRLLRQLEQAGRWKDFIFSTLLGKR